MEAFSDLIHWLAGLGRSWPFIILLVGTGVYFTFKLGAIQFRALRPAIRIVIGKDKHANEKGDVSPFQAFSTVLSGTIGTGNIAGVATAIVFGGPGAVFWMWVTALFAMTIKFAESALAHKYRVVTSSGEMSGGPMYTLKNGLHWPRIGALFAFFMLLGAFTTGGMVQANSMVDGLVYLVPAADEHRIIIGIVVAVLVGIVVLGGIKRISLVAEFVMPFMALSYCLAALFILILNVDAVPHAFGVIVQDAFNPAAVSGGALGSMIQYGVLRALFTSEAGLGTAPIGLSAMRTDEPIRAGLVAMVGPWVDTMIISSMTALVIVISGSWGDDLMQGLNGAALSAFAFEHGLQSLGSISAKLGASIVGISLTLFAFTTMLSWCYYGDRSMEYLGGSRWVKPFRILFIFLIVIGAISSIEFVWSAADIANVLIAIPNLISLLMLTKVVLQMNKEYWKKQGKFYG